MQPSAARTVRAEPGVVSEKRMRARHNPAQDDVHVAARAGLRAIRWSCRVSPSRALELPGPATLVLSRIRTVVQLTIVFQGAPATTT